MLINKGSARKHLIALVGFGHVARGLCEILLEKRDLLKEEHQFEFEIVADEKQFESLVIHKLGSPSFLAISRFIIFFESVLLINSLYKLAIYFVRLPNRDISAKDIS